MHHVGVFKAVTRMFFLFISANSFRLGSHLHITARRPHLIGLLAVLCATARRSDEAKSRPRRTRLCRLRRTHRHPSTSATNAAVGQRAEDRPAHGRWLGAQWPGLRSAGILSLSTISTFFGAPEHLQSAPLKPQLPAQLYASARHSSDSLHTGSKAGPSSSHCSGKRGTKIVILFGLARRTARKSRKCHYFTRIPGPHAAGGGRPRAGARRVEFELRALVPAPAQDRGADKVQRHFLEGLLRQRLGRGREPVAIAAAVLRQDPPADLHLGAGLCSRLL